MSEKNIIEIKKIDNDRQIVVGEVYAPDITDAHGDFMTAQEIEKTAYDFMANHRLHKIDMQHDNEETGSFVVESFIARKGDETFIEGAWVVAVHIPDKKVWDMVKNGELNGFSMEALALKKQSTIEMHCPLQLTGETDSGGEDDHTHRYTIFIDEGGKFNGGTTNLVNNHKHDIITGTTTEDTNEHVHKYNFVDMIAELGEDEEEGNSE